jgi:ABC-type glutathione transport system ATPase component
MLLLDEPTAGVDPDAAASIMQLITQLNHEQDLTVVLVTHQRALVHQRADSVVWVEAGRAEKGPAASVLTADSVHPFQRLRGSE